MEVQNEAIIVLISAGLTALAVMWYLQRTQRENLTSFNQTKSEIVFIAIVAVGVLIRVYLAYYMPGYQSDMDCFRAWSRDAYAVGLDHFYDGDFFADYPPLYVYVLYVLGAIQSATGLSISGPDYAVLLRLPSIIAEVLVAFFFYRTSEPRFGKNTACTLSALIMLNPALMMNSSVWGQIDSIAVLMMLGVFWLLYRKRFVWSTVVFMLSFLLKPQCIFVAPVIFYVLIDNIARAANKKKAWLELLLSVVSAVAVWFLVPLPFGVGKDPLWLVQRYANTISEYSQACLNAFNLYGLLGLNWVDAQTASFLGLSASNWGVVAVIGICAYAAWLFYMDRTRHASRAYTFVLAGFMVAAVFTLVHGMHERYLYPAPFFLLAGYVFLKDKRLLDGAVMLFAVQLVNQGVSLYYYQQWIPASLMAFTSALEVAAFAYVTWSVTEIALHGADQQILIPRATDTTEHGDARIEQMLNRPLGYRKCDRKDWGIALIITAVYAAVAFSNLGTFDIPGTSAAIEGQTTISFGNQEHVTQFRYYADYGEGVFEVEYSPDGENFYPALTGDDIVDSQIDHQKGNLYKWQKYDLDVIASAIRISQVGEGSLPILEVAFFGDNEVPLTPVSVVRDGAELSEWTDEQDIVPYERTYLTDFYFDEIYHVRTAYENIHLLTPYEITHPPLGKILLAIGIEMFGMNSVGWRFMGTLAGVCMVPVMYVMARMLFSKRKYAVFASVLLCSDFMHYAQTRIGTVDSYSILWIMCMYLFMYRYATTNFNRQPLREVVWPLFFSGLFFGIGAATKWLCLYAGVGLLVIYILLLVQRVREYRYCCRTDTHPEVVDNFKRKFWAIIACGFGFFILIPACIYLISYTPYTLVSDGGAYGLKEIIGNQSYMLNYHANLNPDHVHPFSSKWYTWPADVRPVLFFSNQTDSTIATLSTMGNPFIWWIGILAVICLAIMCWRDPRYRRFGILFLAIGAVAEFAPWWFITREVFIYHYFAVIPFLILLIVYWLQFIEREFAWGKAFGYACVSISVAFFVVFYPVITGVPYPKDYINAIRWLESWPFY